MTSGATQFLSALQGGNFPSASSPGGSTNFQAIEQVFAAQGVPDPVWESVVYSEDSSLDPTIAVSDPDSAGDPGTSYGWFQFRQGGAASPSLGDSYAQSDLTDPYKSSQIAAGVFGQAIANYQRSTGDTSMAGAIRAIAQAGWPGAGATPAQIAQREANLQAIADAQGQGTQVASPGAGSGAAGNPGSPAGPTSASDPYAGGALGQALGTGTGPYQGIPGVNLATPFGADPLGINTALTRFESWAGFGIRQVGAGLLGLLLLIGGIWWIGNATGISAKIESDAEKAAPIAEAAA